jgi:alanine--tRNA ligase
MSVYEGLTESQQFAARVIADHARATAFAIADGILPGNEGRNYVLRKIMRRAIYHGREHLGFKEPFFFKVCDTVVERMHGAFPELAIQREFIGKMVRLEEERFGNTMTVGLGRLSELGFTSETAKDDQLFLQIAKLYDTYGTPRDLIRVFLEENGIEFEEDDYNDRFEKALQELQQQSGIGKTERKSAISPIYAEVLGRVGWNKFHGYDGTTVETANVVAIVDGDSQKESLGEGEQGGVILDETPFYAESGGQVGDGGYLSGLRKNDVFTLSNGESGTPEGVTLTATVADTYSPVAGLIIHKVKVESGNLKVGDKVTAVVDSFKRDATRRNHTATHLLHAALKEVLGTHVKQAGSVVAPNYLRFDFSHYQPMSEAEIQEVEDLVNRYILQNHQVSTNLMAIEEAMRSGAVAMFGEKYGAEVRVLSVGDGKFSMELCGGTHVRATGDIGSFKITSDEAIASGVRRIRAITGLDAFERFRDDERLIDRSLEALKTQRDNLPNAIERLQEEVKRTRKEIEELKLKIATGGANGASSNEDEAREIAGVKVLAKVVDGLDANGQRQLSDTLLARLKSGVVVLGRKDEGKASIIVRVSDDLKDRVKAGNVIKEIVPIIGGKGGGRPDMAEGGGPDADKLNDAIEAGYKVIETFLSP